MASSPHCPACAAPLPPIERQEIVTCESCGTDCNADYQAAPMAPPRSPPLSPERTWSRDDEKLEDWEAGAYVHALLSERDPVRRLEIARLNNGHLQGDEALLWAPALGEGVVRAEREGDAESALEIAFQLYDAGCGRRDYPYHFNDDARNPDRPLRAADLALGRPIESKSAWVLLSVAQRILAEAPESPAGLIALAGVGTPALQTLLRVATEAQARGDHGRAGEALACVRTLLVRTEDDERYGVVFDAAAHLLPGLTGRVQQTVIDGLAEVADGHFMRWGPEWGLGEHLRVYPEEWRGPSEVLTLLLTLFDDLLHEHPELAGRLMDAIVRGTSPRTSTRQRWKAAMQAVVSPEGRDACERAYLAVFGPEPEPAPEWRHPRDDSPEPIPEPIIPETMAPRGVKVARARAGQAPCPGCGRALRLSEGGSGVGLITTCDHCGQRARVAREVRTIRRVIDAGTLALHTWTPERLVTTMIDTTDNALRLAIAKELASATSDGGRFAELAPALVAYIMAPSIPSEVEELLQDGFESMLRFRDPTFLQALFAAIRAQAFTDEGSDRLLLALEKAGPAAGPLLIDLVDKVTQGADGWGKYTQRAKQVGWTVLQRGFEEDPRGTTEFMLARMQNAGAALSDELPSLAGHCCFDREGSGLDEAQRLIVAFIDEHLDPAKIIWYKGMTAYAPDLCTPNYSWTAEDVAAAERNLGLKWAQGGELDTQRITAAIACLPGSRVSLRQVQMLISQLESFWKPPETGGELVQRLRLATQMRHEALRVMILARLYERPAVMSADEEQLASEVLGAFRAGEHEAAWAAFVARCLAEPGHAERTAEAVYAKARPTAGGSIVRRLLDRLGRIVGR